MKQPTTFKEQFLQLKRQHPNAVIFMQSGNFYQLIGLDAFIGMKIFDFKVTVKAVGDGKKFPMVGTPIINAKNRMMQLHHAGFNVVVVHEDVMLTAGIKERIVVKTLTCASDTAVDLLAVYGNAYRKYMKGEFLHVLEQKEKRDAARKIEKETQRAKQDAMAHFNVELALLALDLNVTNPKQAHDLLCDWKQKLLGFG